ncbi:MAG: M20/M25/M40 family metallo-hydrolase [Chloroflexaceae bacterium]|jgi:tripeptide aminopeptidase|nr:M20/M25/M40 family metallo-hydrolase [Chloroflexaceae bacterium]
MQPKRLLDTFLELVRFDNPSGEEAVIVAHLRQQFAAMGLETQQDAMHNLLVRLPGEGEPILLNAHTDSVKPCTNVRPVVADGVVRSSGDTVLGADDLAGVAAILEAVRSLRESGGRHRAAELLFTSQEEVGLRGAAAFDYSWLRARHGFVFDVNGEIGGICLGAPAQDSLHALITGKAAHAGVEPEKGISAIQVAAAAIGAMPLGRIDEETTANIGIIRGGEATNIVTPQVELWGEARSHTMAKLAAQSQAMVETLQRTAETWGAQVDTTVTRRYDSYRLSLDEPVVQEAMAVLQQLGVKPYTFISGGGSDANIFCGHGLRIANLSVNYRDIHSVNEHLAIADLETLTRLAEELLKVPAA